MNSSILVKQDLDNELSIEQNLWERKWGPGFAQWVADEIKKQPVITQNFR